MRTSFDFTPYRRSTVGFDRLFDLLENSFTPEVDNYPPFDLVQEDEDRYRITMAVAGFRPDEIEITAHPNLLIVAGRRKDEEDGRYIHRGIAARPFERRFGLADFVQVKGADFRDGMLSIELAREIPEEMKPRRIEIAGGEPRRIESDGGAQNAVNENEKRKESEAA